MAEIHSYLVGLKAELVSAEKLGKDTVADIRAEIARIEGVVAAEVHHSGQVVDHVAAAAASDEEKAARYLAALKDELASVLGRKGAEQRVADIKAEIANVEKAAAPVVEAVEAVAATAAKK